MVFPNYYRTSVFYYTDIFALLLVLIGLVFYLKSAHIWVAPFFKAAISFRQYMLAFPAAIIIDDLIHSLKRANSIGGFYETILSNKIWIFYSIIVPSIIPWIILWKGFAPQALTIIQHYAGNQSASCNPGFVLHVIVYLYPAQQAYNEYFTSPFLSYLDQIFCYGAYKSPSKQMRFGILMLITHMRSISPKIKLAGWFSILNTPFLGNYNAKTMELSGTYS
jgi:hypothetical protein